MKQPGWLICHGCKQDIPFSGYDEAQKVWLYECPDCSGVDGPLTLELRDGAADKGGRRARGGVLADLGVYDGVKEALSQMPDAFLEFAVLEHLYAQADPPAYRQLVEDYGHVALGPDTHTASWMIGRAAWALAGEGEVLRRTIPAGTGRWKYLSPCHCWALAGTPETAPTLTWEAFAVSEGFSPFAHPAIGWRETPNASEA